MKEISSVQHPAVKRWKALREEKGRKAQGRMLVEGETLIAEALDCGLCVSEVMADAAREARFAPLCRRCEDAGAEAYAVAAHVLEAICDTVTPQGVAATFELPTPPETRDLPERLVALDGIQDPGNLGTIWRTADAAGFQGLLCSSACANLYAPKVQRAAMGSGFRIPARVCESLGETLSELRDAGYTLVVSALDGAPFYAHPPLGRKFVLVIGSEAHGASADVMLRCDMKLKLPMRGGAESLNAAVAAGIMMYELTRTL